MDIHIVNISCAIVDIIEMLFFYSIFLKKRDMKRNRFLGCFMIAAMLSVGKLYLEVEPEVNLLLSTIICIAVAFIFYKSSIKNRLFAAVVFIIIAMLSESVAQYMLKTVLGVAYCDISMKVQKIFAPLSAAITMVILLYMKKIHKKQLTDIPWKYSIPIMLVPIFSLSIILIVDRIIILSNIGGEEIILPFVLMLLYVNFVMFDFIESYSNKIMLESANEIIRIDKENYQILERNEMELRDLRHDMRKHMQIIRHLKKENNSNIDDKLEEYIEDLQNTVNKITSVSYTGNEVLDSILNIKGKKAKLQNIKYFVKSNIETKLLINDMDITTLLCNALDNAIEGTMKTDDPTIVIYIESNDKNVEFLIENTADNVIFVNGEIETTKKDKKNHGRGLNNIKTCVKKYDGTVRISYSDEIFTIDIKIPNTDI